MRYTFAAATLLASASLVVAAPAPAPDLQSLAKRGSFTIDQVKAPKLVYKNGALERMKTYNKYAKHGAKAPTSVQEAAARAQVNAAAVQSGSVTATPEEYDEAYLCPVTAGDQTLSLDFDTGSSDLWVFSTYLPASQQGDHTLYKPSSSAERYQGETWDISYGDGSGASGIVFWDEVVIGPVTATKQAVEAATSVSSQFVDGESDGLVGLAFDSINQASPTKVPTFFSTVEDTLAEKLFAASLKHGEAGSYDFGFIDDSKYTGDITYVDVDDSQGFWGFNAGKDSSDTTIGSSIADTGTTLLYLPNAAVSGYYSQIDGAYDNFFQGGWTAPCDSDWPDWSVEIGGTEFTVPGSYLNYAPASGSNCFGGIQSNSGLEGLNIFGDMFLKGHYVVFSKAEGNSSPQLGFANQA